MSGTLTVSGVQTVSSGTKDIGPLTIPMGNVGSVTDVTLAAGDNVIAVPSLATGCVIVPPVSTSTPSVSVTFKGAATDTGVGISNQYASVFTFSSPAPASFILNASAAMTAATEVTFF